MNYLATDQLLLCAKPQEDDEWLLLMKKGTIGRNRTYLERLSWSGGNVMTITVGEYIFGTDPIVNLHRVFSNLDQQRNALSVSLTEAPITRKLQSDRPEIKVPPTFSTTTSTFFMWTQSNLENLGDFLLYIEY